MFAVHEDVRPLPKLGNNFSQFEEEVKDALELKGWDLYIKLPFGDIISRLREWTKQAPALPSSVVNDAPKRVYSEAEACVEWNIDLDKQQKLTEILKRFKMSLVRLGRLDEPVAVDAFVLKGSESVSCITETTRAATQQVSRFQPENLLEERMLFEEHSVFQLLKSAIRSRSDSRAENETCAFALWAALAHHFLRKIRPMTIINEMVTASPAQFPTISAYYQFLRIKQRRLKMLGRTVEESMITNIFSRGMHGDLRFSLQKQTRDAVTIHEAAEPVLFLCACYWEADRRNK